jgi:hypothetical protein
MPGGNPPVKPSISNYIIQPSNSNITELINILPDEISYQIDFSVNPNGNVSGGNDFVYYEYGLKSRINMEIPLSMMAERLTLSDTTDFNTGAGGSRVIEGVLHLIADNGFPFDAEIQMYTLNELNETTDSLFSNTMILAASVDANDKVTSTRRTLLEIPVSKAKMEILRVTRRIRIVTRFTTNPGNRHLKIYSDYSVDFKLTGDFTYLMQ